MRGQDIQQATIFRYLSPAQRVPAAARPASPPAPFPGPVRGRGPDGVVAPSGGPVCPD